MRTDISKLPFDLADEIGPDELEKIELLSSGKFRAEAKRRKPEHSPLGASSAARWMNCPGSPRLLSSLPTKDRSEFADLGTEAHALAAYCLLHDDVADSFIDTDFDGEFSQPISEETANAVNVYLAAVRKVSTLPGARFYVEDKLVLEEIDPMLWGTADCIVYVPKFTVIDHAGLKDEARLYVFDYKHGVGVSVAAEDNPQLGYYAFGAWISFRHLPIDKIVTTIVQPRAPGKTIKSVTLTPLQLYDFSVDLEAAVRRTREPDAPLVQGPWCDNTFCNGRGVCPELRAKALAAVSHFNSDNVLTIDLAELGADLHKLEVFYSYYKARVKLAEDLAKQGKFAAGWKHVLGNGKRVWNGEVSEAEVSKAVSQFSNSVDPFKPRDLKTAPGIEKEMGKDKFEKFLEADAKNNGGRKLVIKSPGGVSLVPVEDKRPAYMGEQGDGFDPVNLKG